MEVVPLFLLWFFFCWCDDRDKNKASSTRIVVDALMLSNDKRTKSESSLFPFVHSSIADILTCENNCGNGLPEARLLSSPLVALDAETLRLQWLKCPPDPSNRSEKGVAIIAAHELVPLALACDQAIFSEKPCTMNHSFFSDFETCLIHLASTSMDGDAASLSDAYCTNDTIINDNEDEAARIVVATLLALNNLESALRSAPANNAAAGRAPLFKDMLATLSDNNNNNKSLLCVVTAVLQALLLPTGLNLRNLLWHGFVGAELPRPWLSLVLVLIKNVQEPMEASIPKSDQLTVESLSANPNPLPSTHSWKRILNKGERLRQDPTTSVIPTWLPASHQPLWQLATRWMAAGVYPAVTCVVLSILTEHALRLDWCRANRAFLDAMAQPARFYVTLDGHGQRDKHNLLLHPYRTVSETIVNMGTTAKIITTNTASLQPNALVHQVGGSTVALMTDLFAAACGGPNIRANLAHGLWDNHLRDEVMRMRNGDSVGVNAAGSAQVVDTDAIATLWNMMRGILVAMEQAADPANDNILPYRPVFSYTATTIQNLQDVRGAFVRLSTCLQSDTFMKLINSTASVTPRTSTDALSMPLSDILLNLDTIHAACSGAPSPEKAEGVAWTTDDVFAEYETNRQLATQGAARTLLNDVNAAVSSFGNVLENVLKELREAGNYSTRKRRRMLRIVASTRLAWSVYGFATLVAILRLEEGMEDVPSSSQMGAALSSDELLKAVERARMVVSTVDSFIVTNSERAFKAANEYTKGKAVKKILANKIRIP